MKIVESTPEDVNPLPIHIAVIGCGYWGINYVRVFEELLDSEVVAVCDQRPERLKEIKRHRSGIVLTTDLEEVLQLHPDAVVISTEAASHYAVAKRCLQARCDVLVEKPLTTSVAEAEALTSMANGMSAILMVGHTFIYNLGVRKVKEILNRATDRVYYLHACRTNLGPVRHDVNALWDLATHDIAVFNYLLGSVPEWVIAVGARVLRNCREDVGFISMGYPEGIVGHIHVSWADPNKARETVVVCSDRRIVFNDLSGIEQVRIFERGIQTLPNEPQGYGEHRLHIRDGDIVSPRVPVSEPLKEQCRHFLSCIRNRTRPLTSGYEGSNVLRVLEAVDRSLQSRGARAEVLPADYEHVCASYSAA